MTISTKRNNMPSVVRPCGFLIIHIQSYIPGNDVTTWLSSNLPPCFLSSFKLQSIENLYIYIYFYWNTK